MRTPACYLCSSKSLATIRTHLRPGRGGKRRVFQCKVCKLVFLDAPSEQEELQKYYASTEYRKKAGPVIGMPASSRDVFETYYPVMGSRLAKAKKYLGKDKRVLDIGCSAGHFLAAIMPYVKEAVGLEFSRDNAAFVRKKLGIKVYTEPIEKTDLPKSFFDVIFCLQTLEHMPDPLHFLETLKPFLKPSGLVYIEVPNRNEGTLSLYHNQAYDDFYYHDAHLFYYDPKTLRRLFRKAGYVGTIVPFQWYNIINQMHWLLVHRPQRNGFDGLRAPVLVTASDVPKRVRDEFNDFIQSTDSSYKALLEKHMRSDQMIFVGRPRRSKK